MVFMIVRLQREIFMVRGFFLKKKIVTTVIENFLYYYYKKKIVVIIITELGMNSWLFLYPISVLIHVSMLYWLQLAPLYLYYRIHVSMLYYKIRSHYPTDRDRTIIACL